jgi:hypothetical protein
MSIDSDAPSEWTVLNNKKRGMVISIVTLGVLFMFLAATYIWVTHRFRVTTNNPGGEILTLYESSTV